MQLNSLVSLLLLFPYLAISWAQLTPRAQADLITNLPDITFQYTARMFGGYLKPDPTKLMYYWYFESQRSPADDPLLLWLEGGPGCSSVGSIFKYNGPIHGNVDQKTLFENVFSWNKFANILYIDSPAPVGFSHYINQTIPASVPMPPSDDSTAVDNYNALIDFFNNIFPNLKPKDFYLTGHSYSGTYLPLLAIQIIQSMKTGQFQANLKGMVIGNGIFSEKRQHNTLVPFMYYHGLIGSSMWYKLKDACCPNTCMTECDFWSHMKIGPGTSNYISDNSLCGNLTWITTEYDQWGLRDVNDVYDIYEDCYTSTSERNHRARGLNLIAKAFTDGANYNYDSTDNRNGFDCWASESAFVYLNRPDVQAALHINMPNFQWSSCSGYVENNFNRTVYELDTHFDFILQNSNISILIYAGDIDMVCNFMMQEIFINDVAKKNNLTLYGDRSPWMFRGRIAGYQRIYDRIHHVTVKGSGHLVPQERPGPALQMVSNFLFNHVAANYSIPVTVSTDPQPLLPQYQPQPAVCTTTTTPNRQNSNIASSVLIAMLLFVVNY